MHIGIDFDNTIVCYDKVFHKVAIENGLIPENMPPGKNNVRDHLRKVGEEDEWTRLQGFVYGTKMDEVQAFEGVFEFLFWCRREEIQVSIISHKTQHPYIGPEYDLHLAARQWMEGQGLFDHKKVGLPKEQVFLELTKEEKLRRIGKVGCTLFIDDLPEFLSEPMFPKGVAKMLFDPKGLHKTETDMDRFFSWAEISREIERMRGRI